MKIASNDDRRCILPRGARVFGPSAQAAGIGSGRVTKGVAGKPGTEAGPALSSAGTQARGGVGKAPGGGPLGRTGR